MSCAAFTIVGTYALAAKKNADWIVASTFVLAVVFLIVAAYLAWKDEHDKVAAFESTTGAPQLVLFFTPMDYLEVENTGGTDAFDVHLKPVVSKKGPPVVLDQAYIPHLAAGQKAILMPSYKKSLTDSIQEAISVRFTSTTLIELATFNEGSGRSELPLTVGFNDYDGRSFEAKFVLEIRGAPLRLVCRFINRQRVRD